MSIIAEYILYLPGTNWSVERLFSPVNTTWTSSKTKLLIETLRAILIVKCNFKLSCVEFYKYLLKMPTILRQSSSKNKYKVITNEREIEMLTDNTDEENAP